MENKDVYDRYAQHIMRFFSNKAAAANDIDDLMHTTFLRYFERCKREHIRYPLRFLYRIAHNVLLEYWRKRKRADLHDEIGELSLADLGAGITTLIAQDQSKQRVLDSLRTLRLDFQIAVELRYWERLSYKEISEIVGANPATIGVWLRRSREQLKKLLNVPDHEDNANDNGSSTPREDGSPPERPDDICWADEEDQDSKAIAGLMEKVRDIASGRDDDGEDL